MRFFVFLILTLSVSGAAHAQAQTLTGTVYQTVNVRSGPDNRFEIVAQLEEGQTVTVNGRESAASRWLRIVLADESSGWVTAFALTLDGDIALLPVVGVDGRPTPDPQAAVIVIAYGRVNVRSGPEISYDVVGQLEANEEAPVLARSNRANDWLYIERGTLAGWVAYFTVTVIGDLTGLPVRVPDATNTDLVPPSALALTRYNVRLRAEPSLSAAVIAVLPFGTQVSPAEQTPDGRWLYVLHEGGEGWALTQFFDFSPVERDQLPVVTPVATVAP